MRYTRWVGILLVALTLTACTLRDVFGFASAGADSSSAGGDVTPTGEGGRTARVSVIQGTVEVSPADGEPFAQVTAGDLLAVGSTLRTGSPGQALLELDDGTLMVITENSRFSLTGLSGTTQSPITRFVLAVGQIFSLRGNALPADAVFEIETPAGVAAIRGSSMGAGYDDSAGLLIVTCLEGTCGLTVNGTFIPLTGNQQVQANSGGPGTVGPMTPEQLALWQQIIDYLNNIGKGSTLNNLCRCVGPDFTCTDGTVFPASPICERVDAGTGSGNIYVVDCYCNGSDLVCPGQTVAASPMCTGPEAVVTCHCNGTDAICEDGVILTDAEACGGTGTRTNYVIGCTCDGDTMVCPANFTPNDSICAQPGDKVYCHCEGVDAICDDGVVLQNQATCAGNP